VATAPDKALPPIIVKRVKKAKHEAHGGVWKIAYADFVTAMMAFFLLMWVLGSTTSGDLAGISAYFQNPLRIAVAGGSGSGDATRIIKGGGDNIFKQAGQESKADSNTPQAKISNEEEVDEKFNRKEQQKLEELKQDLSKQISENPELDKVKSQIFMDITSDGLRIQIVDEKNRPMFESGSAVMAPQTRQLLNTIGKVLSGLPNRLRIEGHTDSRRFGGGLAGYGNWELSSDRANAARRAIVTGGLDEVRIALVAGFADSVQLNPADATDPLNRRISLMVLKPVPGARPVPAKQAGEGEMPGSAADKQIPSGMPPPPVKANPAEPAAKVSNAPAAPTQAEREAAAAARPYSAGMMQQAGSGGNEEKPLSLFPVPPDGMKRREEPPPVAPVPAPANNRGQAFILPARK
jgi:chemotaxis protein MotB